MRFYLLLMLLAIASPVCADDMKSKKIMGKPGVSASFVDKEIIHLAVGENKRIDLAIHYSADAVTYELQATHGLDVVDLKQSYIREDVTPGVLIIPLEIKADQSGRYYLHVHLVTSSTDGQTKGVLSKIISSEPEINETVQKKNINPKKFKIFPVVETIKDANDE